MDMSNYQKLAARTINNKLTAKQKLMHSLFGLASEVGEIHALFQKEYQGHPMERDKLVKEIGDVLWMIAELCTVHGFDLGFVAQENIDKLKARYPDGFSEERSLHRAENDR